MITLRPYQQEAVKKLMWAQQFEGADLCVLPTGAGKSIVIAELAKQINDHILVLQPSKEILEQNLQKMRNYFPNEDIGIYSASMKQKNIGFITFATIGSVVKSPELFGHFKVVIIDEAHLVNPKNLGSMYTSFFKAIGNPKIIGLTATPYRQSVMYERTEFGELLTHTTTKIITRMKERFWSRLVFNMNNHELVDQKFLVPLQYIDKSVLDHNKLPTNISKSDFNLTAAEKIVFTEEDKVLEAIFFGEELSKSVLVFCSSVEQAEHLSELVEGSAVVSAKTPAKLRAKLISDFKSRAIKTIFNVGVLTTGFDHPELDCIVLLRPTRSIGLYYQMLGRGVRKAEGKTHCKVIDLSGTVKELGRIETIKLIKREKWELESEKGSWHNKPMYSFLVS